MTDQITREQIVRKAFNIEMTTKRRMFADSAYEMVKCLDELASQWARSIDGDASMVELRHACRAANVAIKDAAARI